MKHKKFTQIERELLNQWRKEAMLKLLQVAKGFIHDWSNVDNREALELLMSGNDSDLAAAAAELLGVKSRGKNAAKLSDDEYKRLNEIGNRIRNELMARKLGRR